MATMMPDLSQVQTINYGGGQTLLYDPTTGAYYDNGGNALAPSDVAQYGAPMSVSQGIGVGTGTAAPGATPAPAGATSSTNGIISGLMSLFSSVGGVGSALNPPKTVGGVPMVFNSATGGYVPAAAAGSAVSNLSLSPIMIFLGVGLLGVIIFFAFKK